MFAFVHAELGDLAQHHKQLLQLWLVESNCSSVLVEVLQELQPEPLQYVLALKLGLRCQPNHATQVLSVVFRGVLNELGSGDSAEGAKDLHVLLAHVRLLLVHLELEDFEKLQNLLSKILVELGVD